MPKWFFCYNRFMIKVVVLDFDDTLCMTEEVCFYMENDILESMGLLAMSRETHKKWGMALAAAIAQRAPGVDVEEFMKRIEKLTSKYHATGKFDTISNENLQSLDELKKAGYKLAILTSRSIAEMRHLLHGDHPLSERIERFYHKDNSTFLKPDPRVFDQVFEDFNVTPVECVYVGDTPTDAQAAKGANMHFIALLESGLRTEEDFSEYEVDFFAKKFPDIIRMLQASSAASTATSPRRTARKS